VSFQKACDVFVQHFGNSVNIVLSHGPVSISHGRLVGKACEPLMLRTRKPTVSVDLEEKDALAVSRTLGFSPKLLDDGGVLDLNSFDRYSNKQDGNKSPEVGELLKDGHGIPSIAAAWLAIFLLSMVISIDDSQRDNKLINSLINYIAETQRHAATRQPILKASNCTPAGQNTTRVPPEEVEALSNRLEMEATSRLIFGKQIEDICEHMFDAVKNLGGKYLPFGSWSEVGDMMREMDEELSEKFEAFADEVFGAGQSGIGCNVPLLIHTFSFPSGNHGTAVDKSEGSDKEFDWTLALDVGWIEEDVSWMYRHIFFEDIANARSWYAFPCLKKAEAMAEKSSFSKDEAEERFSRLFSSFFGGGDNAEGGAAPTADDVENGGASSGNDSPALKESDPNARVEGRKGRASNGGLDGSKEFDIENFDPDNFMEMSERWRDMFKSMSDFSPGAGDFFELRLKALMRKSLMQDIED
jgi:hypothetical protein